MFCSNCPTLSYFVLDLHIVCGVSYNHGSKGKKQAEEPPVGKHTGGFFYVRRGEEMCL